VGLYVLVLGTIDLVTYGRSSGRFGRPSLSLPRYHTNYWYSVWYNLSYIVDTARKITVEIPQHLLEKAQQASGTGITQTVRTGLQLLAASQAYKRLRGLRGRVRFTRTPAELKADR
jgi:hypothetical protein